MLYHVTFWGGQLKDGVSYGNVMVSDDPDQTLYAEIKSPDSWKGTDPDEYGRGILQREILQQAREKGIPAEDVIFS